MVYFFRFQMPLERYFVRALSREMQSHSLMQLEIHSCVFSDQYLWFHFIINELCCWFIFTQFEKKNQQHADFSYMERISKLAKIHKIHVYIDIYKSHAFCCM